MSPQAPLRPCPAPGCSALVVSGRCPTHAVEQAHQRDNYDIRRWYRQARWRRLRLEVLRDEPMCHDCRQSPSVEVDHVQKHEGNEAMFFSRANLAGMCARCHTRKTRRGE